jgi:hypothetical protein
MAAANNMARNNRTIVAEINRTAATKMGSYIPSGKSPDDAEDTINRAGFYKPEKVRTAQEVPGAAHAAVSKQGGISTPSGGLIGDFANHPQSGGSTNDEDRTPRKSYSPKSAKSFNSKHA